MKNVSGFLVDRDSKRRLLYADRDVTEFDGRVRGRAGEFEDRMEGLRKESRSIWNSEENALNQLSI